MKKVAIVRGASLNKWDMQIYEPLIEWFDIVGIGSRHLLGDAEGISFPIVKLVCPLQYVSGLPKFLPVSFSLMGDANWLLGFSQAVKGFDLLHAVELSNAYSLQAVRAKKRGLVKAVTLAVYENIPFSYDEYDVRRKIKEEVIAGADHFLAVNKMTREMLLVEGVEKRKISIVPQSVDIEMFRPYKRSQDENAVRELNKKMGIGKNDFVVLRAGRMVWEKGWYDLVRAAAVLKKQKKIKFLFIGQGKEKSKLQSLVKREGLSDSVIFAEQVPYSDLPDIYRLADVFVQSSLSISTWQEQLGTVVMEAMASGLPIIGTLSGATKHTVGEDGGIFVQPQDFVELADAVLKLYGNEKLRGNIGKRNRRVALEKYDNKVVAKSIKIIWEKVLADSK